MKLYKTTYRETFQESITIKKTLIQTGKKITKNAKHIIESKLMKNRTNPLIMKEISNLNSNLNSSSYTKISFEKYDCYVTDSEEESVKEFSLEDTIKSLIEKIYEKNSENNNIKIEPFKYSTNSKDNIQVLKLLLDIIKLFLESLKDKHFNQTKNEIIKLQKSRAKGKCDNKCNCVCHQSKPKEEEEEEFTEEEEEVNEDEQTEVDNNDHTIQLHNKEVNSTCCIHEIIDIVQNKLNSIENCLINCAIDVEKVFTASLSFLTDENGEIIKINFKKIFKYYFVVTFLEDKLINRYTNNININKEEQQDNLDEINKFNSLLEERIKYFDEIEQKNTLDNQSDSSKNENNTKENMDLDSLVNLIEKTGNKKKNKKKRRNKKNKVVINNTNSNNNNPNNINVTGNNDELSMLKEKEMENFKRQIKLDSKYRYSFRKIKPNYSEQWINQIKLLPP